MSWQIRGKGRYYYNNSWQNGRSVRKYFGTGEVGELAATADALRRVEREMERRQRQAELERLTALETPLLELCEQTDLLVRAALVAAGYHQHDRGEWRRKRDTDSPDREE